MKIEDVGILRDEKGSETRNGLSNAYILCNEYRAENINTGRSRNSNILKKENTYTYMNLMPWCIIKSLQQAVNSMTWCTPILTGKGVAVAPVASLWIRL